MNWLNGCTWFDIGMVMGSNLGEPKLNSLFAKISFSLKVKGHGNPSWLRNNQWWLKNKL